MGTLLGLTSLPYGERLSLLNRGGGWGCGGLRRQARRTDQHISQEQPNDIAALLECFPGIGTVYATHRLPCTSSGIFRNYSSGKPPPSSRCPPPARRRRG
ncbi:MAG: hypothetical protein ACLT8E_02500 [Akkermansia sp.]